MREHRSRQRQNRPLQVLLHQPSRRFQRDRKEMATTAAPLSWSCLATSHV